MTVTLDCGFVETICGTGAAPLLKFIEGGAVDPARVGRAEAVEGQRFDAGPGIVRLPREGQREGIGRSGVVRFRHVRNRTILAVENQHYHRLF